MSLVPPVAPTGYSGFWTIYSGSSSPYNFRFARSGHELNLGRELATRGFRKYRAVMRALNGAAPGAVTTDSYRRVTAVQAGANPQMLGGSRAIELVSNATTTTVAMQTAINTNIYDSITRVNPYPVDRSGNGGGGRVGR